MRIDLYILILILVPCNHCLLDKHLPFKPSEAILVPWVRLTNVFPTSLTLKMEGALMSYQSFRVKGSTIFFLAPFLPPLERPYKLHR